MMNIAAILIMPQKHYTILITKQATDIVSIINDINGVADKLSGVLMMLSNFH